VIRAVVTGASNGIGAESVNLNEAPSSGFY